MGLGWHGVATLLLSEPCKGNIFYSPKRPDRLWGTFVLLFLGYRERGGGVPGTSRPGLETNHLTPKCQWYGECSCTSAPSALWFDGVLREIFVVIFCFVVTHPRRNWKSISWKSVCWVWDIFLPCVLKWLSIPTTSKMLVTSRYDSEMYNCGRYIACSWYCGFISFYVKICVVRCLMLFFVKSLSFHYEGISLDTITGSVHVQWLYSYMKCYELCTRNCTYCMTDTFYLKFGPFEPDICYKWLLSWMWLLLCSCRCLMLLWKFLEIRPVQLPCLFWMLLCFILFIYVCCVFLIRYVRCVLLHLGSC